MTQDDTVMTATLEEAAKRLKIAPFSLRIWEAFGCPGPNTADYCPTATASTLAEVAAHFGINRRTAHEWKARGIIVETGDPAAKFNLIDIRARRLKYLIDHGQAPSAAEATGDSALEERPATGDLVRGILRVYAVEIRRACVLAVSEALAECETDHKHGQTKAKAVDRVAELLGERIREFVLDEKQISQVLRDCWQFV